MGTIDGVEPGGEGGLLGVAVSPTFATDTGCTCTTPAAEDNRIATVRTRDGALRRPAGRLRPASRRPASTTVAGWCSARTACSTWGPGTPATGRSAQDPDSLGGKILRLAPDLRPAAGNPDDPVLAGGAGYSLGHRNVQGLAFDDRARLWASEFGQNTWDELNLIKAGANYGWPIVEGIGDRDDPSSPSRSGSGRPTRRRPAESPSGRDRSGWPGCAVSSCGRSR